MAEEEKGTQTGFQRFCEGMPCGDMMRKMMEGKKSSQPFNCAEMMSQMMKFWGSSQEQKVEPKEPPVHGS